MGVEAVQAQYEAGLYQIISCHTDDDAAAELTPGLAFPVNAAANQTHLPPFTLSSSVSSRPASVSSPSHLRSLSSMFDRSPLHPLPFFSSLSLLVSIRCATALSLPLLERPHGRKRRTTPLVGASQSPTWGFAYEEFIIGHCLSYARQRKRVPWTGTLIHPTFRCLVRQLFARVHRWNRNGIK